MIVAVLPFAADGVDADVLDLAVWLGEETARALRGAEVRVVIDAVPIEAGALGAAAAQLEADAALGATVAIYDQDVQTRALLVGRDGALRAEWSEHCAAGGALQLPRRIARATLLALGLDAAGDGIEPDSDAALVLRFVRAARRADADDLVDLCPALPVARDTLLRLAAEAANKERMPAFLAALERLARERPGDPQVLLALGDYRALHLDEPGARSLFVAARDAAADPATRADALLRLATAAERAGRIAEAVQHLRTAARHVDDPLIYVRLAALLEPSSPLEVIAALTRATVLAPDDPKLFLELARALRRHGEDPARALAAAAQAARLAEGDAALVSSARAEIELLVGRIP